MVKGNAPALHRDPETRRALQLDSLAAILLWTCATGSRNSSLTTMSRP